MRRRKIIDVMKVLHYIPSLDRTSGGTTAYMQLLARELGKLTKLHVVTHISENPVTISECQIHYIEGMKHPFRMKKQWKECLATGCSTHKLLLDASLRTDTKVGSKDGL